MDHDTNEPKKGAHVDVPIWRHPDVKEFFLGVGALVLILVALQAFWPLDVPPPDASDPTPSITEAPTDEATSSGAAISAERVREILRANPDIVVEALTAYEMQQREAAAARDVALVAQNSQALFGNSDDWSGGAEDAPVTLVEFFDYACSFCKRAAPEIRNLLETRDDFRLVKKEFPILSEGSVAAAEFAIATRLVAGDAAYKAFHDALMAVDRPLTQATFQRVASGLDLPVDEIAARTADPKVGEIIDANRRLASTLGIQGTPGYVLPGAILRNYQDRDGLTFAIEEAKEHLSTSPDR